MAGVAGSMPWNHSGAPLPSTLRTVQKLSIHSCARSWLNLDDLKKRNRNSSSAKHIQYIRIDFITMPQFDIDEYHGMKTAISAFKTKFSPPMMTTLCSHLRELLSGEGGGFVTTLNSRRLHNDHCKFKNCDFYMFFKDGFVEYMRVCHWWSHWRRVNMGWGNEASRRHRTRLYLNQCWPKLTSYEIG